MQIEPRTSTTKNPPAQFTGDPATSTTWLEHVTDTDYLA
jgi:hypothetical protein